MEQAAATPSEGPSPGEPTANWSTARGCPPCPRPCSPPQAYARHVLSPSSPRPHHRPTPSASLPPTPATSSPCPWSASGIASPSSKPAVSRPPRFRPALGAGRRLQLPPVPSSPPASPFNGRPCPPTDLLGTCSAPCRPAAHHRRREPLPPPGQTDHHPCW